MAKRKTGRTTKSGKSFWRRWASRLGIAFVALAAVSILTVLPLRWFNPATSAFMLADDSGLDPLLYEWHDATEIGDAAMFAVVAAEDQRFADHHGIDFKSIKDSIEKHEDGGRLRGASTISQQLTKNLFLWNGRSFIRKGIEAYLTLVVELCLPKRRILEIYLNIVELGPGIYGFGSASQYYFGKSAANLLDTEAALLAAVLPNPRRLHADTPTGYLRDRQRWILGEMVRLRREDWMLRLR